MYFYSKEKLEQMADKINEQYYPERLQKMTKLDPYDLLEKMDLEVEWKYITPNKSTLGMIFFEDNVYPVWETGKFKKGDNARLEKFKKGTIVINNILLDEKDYRKEVFVCNHEISHWIKDQKYFKDHPNDVIHVCKGEAFEKTRWNNGMSEIDIIERQTNYLNAAILMPRDVTKKEFFKILRWKNIPNEPIKYEKYMARGIKALSDILEINFNPVLYRLYDLNILIREVNE